MLFWIIALGLSLVVVGMLVLPLVRPAAGMAGSAQSDVAVYRDQLTEVDRDLDRGVIDSAEAERLRTEIARRLLHADRAAAEAPLVQATPSRVLAAVLAVGVVAAAGGLYWMLGQPGYRDIPRLARIEAGNEMRDSRPSQTEMEAKADEQPRIPVELTAAEQEIVDKLRQVVRDYPDELQGWIYLANVERDLENYAAAARAQNEVIRLKAADATEEDYVYLLDLMVAATGGLVSPEAEDLTRSILGTNQDSIAGRYYLGLLYAQTDRPDIAFRLWRDVIAAGDQAQVHVALARRQVEDAAFFAGVDYTLPAERGPSAADMANAANMTPEAQQAMIQSMVAQLSDRLATEGGPASDWARLINAYGVLGQTDQARTIWTEAQDVFGTQADALATIRAAAVAAGVAE